MVLNGKNRYFLLCLLTMFVCTECSKVFSTQSLYNQHITDPNHSLTMSENGTYLRCNVCNMNCNSESQYAAHIVGKSHLKKLKNSGQTENNVSSVLLTASSTSRPMQDVSNLSQFFCEFCNISCTGIEPYKQHITSEKHRKKVSAAPLMSVKDTNMKEVEPKTENNVAPVPPPASSTSCSMQNVSNLTNFFCEFCNISCTGIEPYKQHIASEKHRKKVSAAPLMSVKDIDINMKETKTELSFFNRRNPNARDLGITIFPPDEIVDFD